MMSANRDILISGAGIAGLTLAYWLARFGFNPTVVESRRDLSDEGYMIDFYGSGFDVAEKMGLLDQLRARHYPIAELVIVDKQGKIQATFQVEEFRKLLKFRHFNFMRGDLARALFENTQSLVPIRFSTSIIAIHDRSHKVIVDLSDGTSQDYDLVIGADGFHSKTRQLLWGDDNQFENFLGYYVACAVVNDTLNDRGTCYSYLEPKRNVSIYPIRGNKLATIFAVKSSWQCPANRNLQLDFLTDTCGHMGWIVPQVLDAMKQMPQLYFDAVSQIKLSAWYKGRVALVGDACQCLTLLAGQGASMAMAGAYLLANELHQANGDYAAAFAAYQDRLKPEINRRQIQAQRLAKSFVPDNYFSIKMMNLVLRSTFLPGFKSLFLRQIGAKSVIK